MSDKVKPLPADLQRAIQELFFWQYNSDASNFHAKLYALIAKADHWNRLKLATGFPAEVLAFSMWEEAPDERTFFEMHGFTLGAK